MSAVETFNLFEVYLWSAMGCGFLIAAIMKSRSRLACLAAGILLILFGVSDWIELSTGAWWKPWWLFVWKAICVVSLVGLAVTANRRQQSGNQAAESESRTQSFEESSFKG